uniref:Uncharacterized protein n=1 Tax=Candidatus Kentrum sp. FW TaxID=2126338 RepID=A0A450TKK6_9GAMM|nr:MAG: hypothetical protein BECKFW1821B_GA0114236_11406 [Candidatus Kentron sp. FW]
MAFIEGELYGTNHRIIPASLVGWIAARIVLEHVAHTLESA